MKSLADEVGKPDKTKSKVKKPREKLAKFGRRKLILLIAGGLILLGLIATFVILNLTDKNLAKNEVKKPDQTAEVQKYYSPLTGREIANPDLAKRAVTAVMIENSPEARPQSGLADAGVIFEAVAEGGITRFIALYQESEPALIGPVRSVRPYYLEWAAAFDPAVAHVGVSDEALAMIRGGNYGVDLDQFFNDSAYWRARDRYAPHNVYTDYTHLANLEKSKNKTTSEFNAWPRTDGKALANPDATLIDLAPSTGLYTVHYDYDATTNTYSRNEGGAPHLDREKGQIAPDVVIALRVQQGLMSDGLHSTFATTGSGEADIFQNGTLIQGKWEKSAAHSQIKFTDETGAEIKLNRGQVWITAVGQGRNISWQ
jgi:hypothetical protein